MMNNPACISDFHAPGYEFLSNFYSCKIAIGSLVYTSAEAAFQAQKCLTEAEKIPFTSCTPAYSKKLGRTVNLRPNWNHIRFEVMETVIRAKFTQNPGLASKLVATGNAQLIEGNTWGDTCWGVDIRRGGANNLGKILMKVREELKSKYGA